MRDLTLYLFDALHVDGEDLIDRGGFERHAALAAVTPTTLRVPRTVTGDPVAAAGFLADALAHGHEGVLVKSLSAPYEAGRRGRGGSRSSRSTPGPGGAGRRVGPRQAEGLASNLHLGARDPSRVGS